MLTRCHSGLRTAAALMLLVLFAPLTYAQLTCITGELKTTDDSPVLGQVAIFALPDSALVKGSLVDSSRFSVYINAKPGDTFFAKFTLPGYTDTTLQFTARDSLVDLGEIRLRTLEVEGTEIKYQRPAYVRTIDGIAFEVQGTELETLTTLFDVLKASPRLTSPDDQRIEIIGRGSPLILVDRQPIISTNELKAIPADQVERIEILTNPPAKYRAQGSSNGVIEIYTKDFHLQGYQMTVNASGGSNTQGNPNGRLGLGLNVKKDKFSLSANLNNNLSERFSYSEEVGETTDETQRRFTEDYESTSLSNFYFGSIKSAYQFNDRQKLTAGVRGYGSFGNTESRSESIYRTNDQIDTRQTQDTDRRYTWLNNSAFANYIWETDTNNSVFEINLNYRLKVSDNTSEFESFFSAPATNDTSTFARRNEEDDRPNIAELRTNYEYKSPDQTFKWSVGGSFSFLRNNKAFDQSELQAEVWREIPALSNSYDYDELIGAAFAEVTKDWGKIGLRGGLRAEYTYLNGYSNSLERQFIDSSYVLPFPSASVILKPSKKLNFTLSYRAGIDRPSFDNFDPFVRVVDSLRIEFGNPYLRPTRTHVFGLETDFLYKYSLSLNYSRTNDPVSEIAFVDSSSFLINTTPANAEHRDRYSASVSIPLQTKWLRGWNSIFANYSRYVFGPGFGRAPFGALSFGAWSSLTFLLPKDFQITNRTSVRRWASDTYRANVQVYWTLRLQKELMDGRLRVFASADNLLAPRDISDEFQGNYFVESEAQFQFTGFSAGVFFKFGRLKQAVQIQESESGQSDRL
ncbi:MAG: outer membrane beta-barrel protein [Bacteroidota bacterium]